MAFAGVSQLALAQSPTQDVVGELGNNEGLRSALHRPILRMAIDLGAVAPVERLAVELRWATPKFF
jgi:hypothetical protein